MTKHLHFSFCSGENGTKSSGAYSQMGFKEIGKKIQMAREERGLTQVGLAHTLGITQAALSNYELGKRRLYFHQIEQIASVLGKRLDFFIQEENGKVSAPEAEGNERALHLVFERISRLGPQELRLLEGFLDYLKWRQDHASVK
jgi:transcriptional regulator with XRE-family HTH domain